MPELAQFQNPDNPDARFLRWETCCEMFRIDPNQTGIDERVIIAGLKTKVYQYQAFGI